jgi:hypothetical protein|tara:strand:- start:1398 stop:1640 length:243 start_codon:yes stop_codon:yes gene_type:complete
VILTANSQNLHAVNLLLASVHWMRHYLTNTDFTELQNNSELDEDKLRIVLEYFEEKELEITISAIIETAIILWGLDFLLD